VDRRFWRGGAIHSFEYRLYAVQRRRRGPPTFFARGVDVLGGIRVTDGPELLEIVSQGGSGYFFGQGAEKVCFVRGAE
jgi:hypothetical protein